MSFASLKFPFGIVAESEIDVLDVELDHVEDEILPQVMGSAYSRIWRVLCTSLLGLA